MAKCGKDKWLAVELKEKLEEPDLEECRKVLEAVRAKLYERPGLFARLWQSLLRGQ